MVSTQNLTQTIVQELGKDIVTERYTAEQPFPIEAELCETFDASRTVLREAVKMLTAKGLLSARPRQGTRVQPEEHWNLLDPDVLSWLLERKFSLPLLAEFAEMRLAIEPMAAGLAAQSASAEQLADIEKAVKRMEAAEAGLDDPLDSDIAFHVAVLNASGNRFLTQFHQMISTALKFSIRFTNSLKGVRIASVAAHRSTYEAIKSGHHKKAKQLMAAMNQEALDMFRKAIAKEQT
ncbi:FadR/GntR family transcriptional regulator [Porticoccus sp. W117]|uniref:FadR/GntR family transcriptional regulator n=1 Tax=Porticoccus sp. W117 TaxID=3054777 RepID=UPI0025953AAD|nr:FadR/GntR family transcriptional regulator [Porticoccus sp. W117]MDM3870060.1 FadR/GntR family transcriptional regulator [Porticoccus sp. W117]